ncbi:hypothetical protein [Pseudomonas sp. ZS1P83]
MCDKQIYDLTARDIEEHGVWYFPMDETVENELAVRPVRSREPIDADFQIIVRTWFETHEGARYVGYIYWNNSSAIGHLQPVMFVRTDECISFWSGMIEPTWADYSSELQVIRTVLPVLFSSEVIFDLEAISGALEGLYSFKDGQVTAFR